MIKIDLKSLEYVLEVTPSEQNVMLVGRHGIGKSKILENYYETRGISVITLFLGQMSDPGDLIGLPEKDLKVGRTDFLLPYWFPTDNKPVVLFLDELNRARPEVLQTIMDLTLNRKLAGKRLPEGSRIISAVNNGDNYTLTELDPALVSRFNIYEFVPTVEEWLLWAEKQKLDKRVINFISENPSFLDGTEFEKSIQGLERTPDRRSWERLSNILKSMKSIGQLELNVISGVIGAASAARFYTSIAQHKLLTAEEILVGDRFDKFESEYKTYSIPELAVINESICRFLETENYSQSQERTILANLKSYFDMIQGKKEVCAHFAQLLTSGSYPHGLVTIATKCQKVYDSIQRFIEEIS